MSGAAAAGAREGVPDRWLPLAYFGFAHLCLATALAVAAAWPRAIGGFYYHPRMLGVVHLVTLGWISGSILGALYLVAPMALKAPLPAGRPDRWAFGAFAIGTTGMASHFWIDEPRGMLWAAAPVLAAFLWVGWRVETALRPARIPAEIKLHFRLAFGNLVLAALLGLAVGVDKLVDLLPGFVLHHVHAHAHLAALGWAVTMVMGAGYRLLPMLLPAAPPRGRVVLLGAVLWEAGVLALASALFAGARWTALPALFCVGGLAVFLGRVRWMLRNRRPPPKGLRRPDWGVLHVFAALLWLVAAAALGAALALGPAAPWKLHAGMAYGVLGLVGFLAQIVVGVESRLLPWAAWLWVRTGSDFTVRPISPHAMPARPLQAAGFALWTAGVPLLAGGLALDSVATFRLGALALLAAVLIGALQQVVVLRRARRRWSPSGQAPQPG